MHRFAYTFSKISRGDTLPGSPLLRTRFPRPILPSARGPSAPCSYTSSFFNSINTVTLVRCVWPRHRTTSSLRVNVRGIPVSHSLGFISNNLMFSFKLQLTVLPDIIHDLYNIRFEISRCYLNVRERLGWFSCSVCILISLDTSSLLWLGNVQNNWFLFVSANFVKLNAQ
jgi:hypothetical protein